MHTAQTVCILGRQPALGLAELESLYGAGRLTPAGGHAAVIDVEPQSVDLGRLGGSLKLARLLERIGTTDWDKLEQQLRRTVPGLLQDTPEGKLKLGLSAYGFAGISPAKLNATALNLKKALKNSGRSVRAVPNTASELNTAQVQHNGLTKPTGCELLLIRDGSTTLLARTIAVQDIAAYAARDQGRPKRDARVGMLPPKLAQIIINLATAASPTQQPASPTQPPDNRAQPDGQMPPTSLLDPFCGTGVILQEALLMGYAVHGSDLQPRMVDYSRANLDWLSSTIGHRGQLLSLQAGDATTLQWPGTIGSVACETYLGQPFSALPGPEKLEAVRSDTNLIIKKFLRNIGRQLPPGSRLCLAVPAWQLSPGRFKHLPLIDQLDELGYNRVSFEHVREQDLLYYRQDQIVARQLLVIRKAA